MTDNVTPNTTKVLPGSTINYTVTINSTGTTAAAAVAFNDVIDINTTLVAGSVKASPIAVDDSYNTIGNVNISLPAAQGVIQNNDLNPNVTGTLEVTQVNATAVPSGGMATATTTHGSVTMHSDGSFDYTPTAGFTGANDTFTYTLGNGTGLTDTATVTIAISGKIWFVNSAAGVNGDGRLSTPFNILTGAGSADSVDAANDVIFLYTSGTNYTGGITLNSGEKIIGQGASQSILTITGFSAPSGTNLLPATGGGDPVITTADTTAISLGANNGLHGFTVGNTGAAGTDISGTSFGTLTVRDVTVNGTGRALNLATGTIASGSTFDLIESSGGSPAEGVRLNAVGGSFTATTTNIVDPTGTGIDVQSAPSGTNFSFGGTTVNKGASVGTGVNLNSNVGTFSFSSLAVTTSNGTGVSATSSGTVNVTTGSIAATGGPALVVNTTAIGMTFTSVSSTNSTTTGISLTSASGSLTIGTTTITNPATNGISATSCSATLNFGNTTANTSGSTGVVLGGSGTGNTGTITFGALNIAPDAGIAGLAATDNTNTITTTSGAINSATAAAVNINRTGGTTPLNITLGSVSSSGGTATGIMIQNTTGSFTVNGDGVNTTKGGNATGGTIATKDDGGTDNSGTVGTAVFLNNATNITLRRMQFNDLKNYGVRGLSVTGFTLQYCTISGLNGDTTLGEEGPVAFGITNPGGANGLLGSGLIDNCKISGGVENNMEFYNQSGTLNALTISNSDVKSNTAATGNDGILIESQASASMTVSVQTCVFDDNKSQAVQFNAIDSSIGDITVNNCTLQRTTQGNEGFVFQNDSNAHLTAHITNNTSTGIGGVVAFVGSVAGNATSSSLLTAVISGNNITHPTTALNSAIIAFLSSTVGQTAPSNIRIASNTVAENSTGGVSRGIFVDTPDTNTTPSFTATVTGNSVSVGDNVAGLQGIGLQARRGTGCFRVSSNTVTFPNGTPAGVVGIRLRQVAPGVANLEQGGSAGTAAIVLAANNPGSTTEVLGAVTVVANGTCLAAPSGPQLESALSAQNAAPKEDESGAVSQDDLVTVLGEKAADREEQKLSNAELR
jgi:hypothetical protein